MTRASWKTLSLAVLLPIATAQVALAQATLSGVITDEAGKPVRGAIVTATVGIKSVSRYSKKDGGYEIAVKPGTYDLAVDAFGFAVNKKSVDTTTSSKSDFQLTPKVDVARFSPADLETLLPNNEDVRLIRRACWGCHNLETVMKFRGATATLWKTFLPTMTAGRLPPPDVGRLPASSAALTNALEKYFGPMAPYLGPKAEPPTLDQVKHVQPSDAALTATITEYTLPTKGAMPNGVMVDRKDRPWWDEYDSSNEIGQLDPVTEEFHVYPMAPHSVPKDGTIGKDGSVWFALNGVKQDVKLAKINPDTGAIEYFKSDDPKWRGFGAHTLAVDPKGNIWSSGHYPAMFDLKSKAFQLYDLPVSEDFPEGSVGTWTNVPGIPKASPDSAFNSYNSVAVDSKGMVYLTKFYEGTIVKLDPKTGKTTNYRAPGMISPHGVAVDKDDNVWSCDTFGYALDKLDAKSGKITVYRTPTVNSSPFGATYDKKTGDIYFGDHTSNTVTRFNPKTATFVEYPLPSPESMPRYVGVDSRGRIWYGVGGPFAGKIGVIDPGSVTP